MKKQLIFIFSVFCISHFVMAQSSDPMGMGSGKQDDSSTDARNGNLNKVMSDAAYLTLKKARPAFASAFKDAQKAVMADDLKTTELKIQKLAALPALNNYEQARLHLINYWYYGKLGNKEMENESAEKLLSLGVDNVDEDAYVEAGMRLLKRQFNGQDLGGAIETLTNLRKATGSIMELNSIASAVTKLDEISSQQTDIIQKVRVSEKGLWTTKLLKPNFFFDSVNGEISEIHFNCEKKETNLAYKADSVMSVPDSWGSCKIKLTTTANTTFNFVQLQSKPSQQ